MIDTRIAGAKDGASRDKFIFPLILILLIKRYKNNHPRFSFGYREHCCNPRKPHHIAPIYHSRKKCPDHLTSYHRHSLHPRSLRSRTRTTPPFRLRDSLTSNQILNDIVIFLDIDHIPGHTPREFIFRVVILQGWVCQAAAAIQGGEGRCWGGGLRRCLFN